MFKYINATVVFILELIMVGSFAWFGFRTGDSVLVRYILAVALPAVAIALWAYWAAPKSSRRLRMPFLVLFRLAMFLLAGFALYLGNRPTFALVVAVLALVTQTISYFNE